MPADLETTEEEARTLKNEMIEVQKELDLSKARIVELQKEYDRLESLFNESQRMIDYIYDNLVWVNQ
jgi:chromosome segregation ATPase